MSDRCEAGLEVEVKKIGWEETLGIQDVVEVVVELKFKSKEEVEVEVEI